MFKQISIYWQMSMLLMILVMIMMLMSVAFLTLLERKLLGYIQERKGPNKLGIMGVIQPFSDAIKLMTKENLIMTFMNLMIYYLAPIFMLLLTFMIWLIYPFLGSLMINNSFIYMICCLSLSVYGLMMTGWSSNSLYSMLGSIRSLAQSISYEVVMSIIILFMIFMINSFNMKKLYFYQIDLWNLYYLWPITIIMMFSLMAELNRTPFDFSEGESELVSGFNVEYMSGGFVLIFLTEYASILLVSMIMSMMFLGNNFFELSFYLKILMLSYLIIWIRGTLPRFRYDLLMYLCWMLILPIILNFMFLLILYKMFK